MARTQAEQKLKDDSPQQVFEDAEIAYDPTTQHVDLSKEEKRRTTALMMAIQAYSNIIIKDADYLREATNNAQRNQGPQIQPATMSAMVEAAIQFDHFIATGRGLALIEMLERHAPMPTGEENQTAASAEATEE